MKPDQKIREEADRLERLARQWISTAGPAPTPTTLVVLPEPQIGSPARIGRRRLRIEVVRQDDTAEFQLVQEENEPGHSASHSDALVLTRSGSAYDVLRDGYEAQEEERLVEFLTPVMDQLEGKGFIEDADPKLVEEVEAIVEVGHLAPSARLRARADIVEFLEGRLGPSEFISAFIERQGHRPQEREFAAELLNERISAT
jgi:hypothetical protein